MCVQFLQTSEYKLKFLVYFYMYQTVKCLFLVPDSVAIAISETDGNRILKLLDLNLRVYMNITKGSKQHLSSPQTSISKTSVLFVSISFIVLMIISLAWLVFYYIQRFRYAHAKERLAVSIN